jgi:hypothetical protein
MPEITSQALAGEYEAAHPQLMDFLNQLNVLYGPDIA